MKRRVELYGRLRDAGAGDSVELEVRPGAAAAEVLEALERALGGSGVLAGAVLATDSAVLSSSEPVPEGCRLAALPPVCGG